MDKINKKIEKIIQDTSIRMDLDQTILLDEIKRAWRGMGEILCCHAQPTSIKDGKLTIVVKEITWYKQLNKLKSDISSQLNRYFNKPVIKDIIFFVP